MKNNNNACGNEKRNGEEGNANVYASIRNMRNVTANAVNTCGARVENMLHVMAAGCKS